MSSEIRLTSTSFIVLGMVDWLGPQSPYGLKKMLEQSIADFHVVPHTTFYAEPARLAAAGFLEETQEQSGRRRKRYALTDKGRGALAAWVSDPQAEPVELRAPAMLKVFFGADPGPLAEAELQRHRRLLEHFERMRDERDVDPVRLRALETGMEYHRFWIAAWERIQGSR